MLPKSQYIKLLIGLVAGLVLVGALACGADEDDAAAAPAPGAAAPEPAAAAAAPEPAAAAAAPEPAAPAAAAAPAATAIPIAMVVPDEAMAMEGKPKFGGVLIWSGTEDSGIFNPMLSNSQDTIRYQIGDPLVKFDEFGDLQPRLAESWTVASDNKSITFNLDRDAKWHDGTQFTSKDVLFSLDMIGDPETATTLNGNLQVGGEYIGYSAPDDFTVIITTPRAHSPIMAGISEAQMIPEHMLGNSADINQDPFNTAPVLTGAMKVVEYKRNEFLRTVKNVDFNLQEPWLDGITYVFFSEWDAGLAAILAGESDAAYAIPQDQPQFERDPDSTVYIFPIAPALTLAFNHAHPAMADKAVRQAFSMSISDKDEWAKTVLRGRGSSAFAFFTPGVPVARFNPTREQVPHEFNLDKARQGLTDAGWAIGGSGLYEKTIDGVVEKLELTLPWWLDEYGEGAQILERDMAALGGVELLIRKVEFSLMVELRNGSPERFRERSMEIWEWPHSMGGTSVALFDPDFTSEVHCSSIPPGGRNVESFCNARVDELAEAGTATFDISERQAITSEIQQIIIKEFSSIPVYYAFDALAATNRIKGITDDTPMSMHFFRNFVYKIWIDES